MNVQNNINALISKVELEQEKSAEILNKFNEYVQVVNEWSDRAIGIVVNNESQTELMEQAKEGRVLLKAKRIEIEKKRVSLKEQSLNEGRLIDSIAKSLIAIIEPAEKHLKAQEDFVAIQERRRKDMLKQERLEIIKPFYQVIDGEAWQLDIMTEEAFQGLLKTAKKLQEEFDKEVADFERKRQEQIEEQARMKKENEEMRKRNAELEKENERIAKENAKVIEEKEEVVKQQLTENERVLLKYQSAMITLEYIQSHFVITDSLNNYIIENLNKIRAIGR